jgi:hypothetical protein
LVLLLLPATTPEAAGDESFAHSLSISSLLSVSL